MPWRIDPTVKPMAEFRDAELGLKSSGRFGGVAGEPVCAFILGMTSVAFHPNPFDLVLGCSLDKVMP